ncbi:MAG: hypothetical protein M3426_13785, partial [Actinomycetota bacterium]|nr:hypothetical protein [Actinomycetota bacterium]
AGPVHGVYFADRLGVRLLAARAAHFVGHVDLLSEWNQRAYYGTERDAGSVWSPRGMVRSVV